MTILVTGGSGFIGSAVVAQLLKRGEQVRALVRSRERLGNLQGVDVELCEGDMLDRGSLERAVRGCDKVYHLAAVYANWLPDPRIIRRANVEGTRNVLEVCLTQGARVVFTSSTAALGAHGKTPANESAQFNLADTGDPYHLSKFESERFALEFASKGLPVVVVNPTNPIGPRDIKPTPTGALIISILKRALPGFVDGGINLIGIQDTAVGHLLAMDKGRPGEKYILGCQNLALKDYFQLIGELGGVRPPTMQLPLALALATAYGYQAIAGVTKNPPLTTPAWVKVGSRYSFWDSSKAVRELGLPQTPIRESLRAAITWFREHGYA